MNLEGLNKQQQMAVLHTEGPCLVLAAAGSGKTAVLTKRAARLIEDGVSPARILLFTFTKKAAEEMKKRLAVLVGEEAAGDVWTGTFHSICLQVLKIGYHELGLPKFETLPPYGAMRLARDILAARDDKHPYGMDLEADPKRLLSVVSRAKADLVELDQAERWLRENTDLDGTVANTAEFWRRYERAKREAEVRLFDFDDFLVEAHRMLKERPEALARWQGTWDYILEDEVQDTNIAQHEIARLLAQRHENYFAVGDVAQSVYGFRGSRPEHTILSFERDYPAGVIIKMPTNYRSQARIVEMGARLIKHNDVREAYSLQPEAHKPAGEPPHLFVSQDEDDEAEQIAKMIVGHVAEGVAHKDVAVLYRINAQSRALEDAMVRHEIPYVVHGSCGFYGRKEIQDVLAFVQLAFDPKSEAGDEALRRVINIPTVWFPKPTHFLGTAFLKDLAAVARQKHCSLWEALHQGHWKDWQWKSIYDFEDFIEVVRSAGPEPNLMIAKARAAGYDAHLARAEGDDAELATDDEGGNEGTRTENLDQLASAATHFDNAGALLAHAAMQRSRARKVPAGADVVQLLTLHRAKGLEWPIVFLCGVSQGLLPHRRSIRYFDPATRLHIIPESIEEERRLAYVGVTRAMEHVHISALLGYQTWQLRPSPFVSEMGFDVPKEYDQDVSESAAVLRALMFGEEG